MPETEWQERLNKIEELNRANLARMDQSERRAAAREKERADQRAAEAATLPPPERIRETLDKFFEILGEMRRKMDRAN